MTLVLRYRGALATCVGIALVLRCASTASAQRPSSNPYRDTNTLATAARDNDNTRVRRLTDHILDTFSGFELPATSSLRDRVFNAERDFRRSSKGRLIRESDVVRGFDYLAGATGAPAWARTSVDQLHLLRVMLKPHIPQMIGLRRGTRNRYDFSDEMSPAEAVLVSVHLLFGKMMSPEYQVVPQDWVKRVKAASDVTKELGRRPAPAKADGIVTTIPREVYLVRDAARAGLRDDTSDASQLAHRFFDILGLGR